MLSSSFEIWQGYLPLVLQDPFAIPMVSCWAYEGLAVKYPQKPPAQLCCRCPLGRGHVTAPECPLAEQGCPLPSTHGSWGLHEGKDSFSPGWFTSKLCQTQKDIPLLLFIRRRPSFQTCTNPLTQETHSTRSRVHNLISKYFSFWSFQKVCEKFWSYQLRTLLLLSTTGFSSWKHGKYKLWKAGMSADCEV